MRLLNKMKFFSFFCFTSSFLQSITDAEKYDVPGVKITLGNTVQTRTDGTFSVADYGNAGSYIAWTEPDVTPGIYELTVQYANLGDHGDRPVDLYVGLAETKVASFKMESTDSWAQSAYKPETQRFSLNLSGQQTFQLMSPGRGPNIDWVELKQVETTTPPPPTTSGGGTSTSVYGGNDWDIVRTPAVYAELNGGNNNPEIQLTYDLSKAREVGDVRVKLNSMSSSGCSSDTADAVTYAPPALELHATDSNIKVLTVAVDIIKDDLVPSNIWDGGNDDSEGAEGEIKLCIRVDLVAEDVLQNGAKALFSVSMLQTQLTLEVKLDGTFGLDALDVDPVFDEEQVIDATVLYGVRACVCDEANDCDDNPDPCKANSVLKICVLCESQEAEIAEVTNYYLEQSQGSSAGGDILFKYTGVEKGKANPVTKIGWTTDHNLGDCAILETPVITDFFGKERRNLKAKGEVMLKFRTNRRMIRARFNLEEKTAVAGGFETEIVLDDGDDASALGVIAVFSWVVATLVYSILTVIV